MDQRARQRQAPPHPARQLVGGRVPAIGEVDDLERLAEGCLVADPEQRSEEADVLPDRQLGVDPVGLCHVADPLEVGPRRHRDSEHGDRAGRRTGEARQEADQGGLAGTVRTEQAVDPAGRQVEVDPVDRGQVPEPLRDALRLDGELAAVMIHQVMNSTSDEFLVNRGRPVCA